MNKKNNRSISMGKLFIQLTLIASLLFSFSAQSGIIASATRVIFLEGDSQKTLTLANTNDYNVIAQVWVDDGENNGTPGYEKYPFVAVPSVFKLAPKEFTNLNIIYNNMPLPKDRESVFWLNIYEIPSIKATKVPNRSQVLMAMNTQMKIFYRPKLIQDSANKRDENLTFALNNKTNNLEIIAHNPSPFYQSFANIVLLYNGKNYPVELESDMMVAPFSQKTYQLPTAIKQVITAEAKISAIIIDDKGNSYEKTYPLK